ncbi:MAG TPA: transglycosylase SLT domain-containing protein [Nocardioidaceae bacterium]|nr:transglycosylase SLT domain-containing protein [Nocardioidaceae bacterium]
MSVAEVTGRIAQIQSQLARLAAPAPMSKPAAASTFSGVLGAAQAGVAEGSAAMDVAGAEGVVPAGAPGSVDGQAVVAEARKYLGVPYLWGGTDPQKGLDCSGLVQLVYKRFGIDLPRVSYQQATAGRAVASMAEARPGDLLAFNSPVDHIGIYIGGGKMIEAPRTGLDVRVVDVSETPSAIRRVLPDQPVADVGAPRGVTASPAALQGTPYASLFAQAGQRHGVSPTLLAAVAKQESGFNPRAVSPAGAQGLMQLMPATAAGLGVANAFDPAQAVDGAARLLKDLISDFGRVDLALAAYNAGPGAVKRYGGIPPYPETRSYVPAVLAHKAALERA